MAETAGSVDERDLDAAFSGPAILSNRFIVTLGPAGARIAFAEQRSTEVPPLFRTAVLLNYPDAIELYTLLKTLLQPIEATFTFQNKNVEPSNGE